MGLYTVNFNLLRSCGLQLCPSQAALTVKVTRKLLSIKDAFCFQLVQAVEVYEKNGIDISLLEDTLHNEECYYGDP